MIAKRLPGAPHETLLVLDGTIGQNAVQQAKIFARGGAGHRARRDEARRHRARRHRRRGARGASTCRSSSSASASRRTTSCRSTRRVRAGAAGRRSDATRAARPRAHRGSTPPVDVPQGRRAGARRSAAQARHRHRGRSALPRPAPLRGREHRRADLVARAGDGWDGHRPRDLEGRDPDAEGAADLPGGAAGRHRHDRGLVARPAVPRSHDRQGRRAAASRAPCASSTAASSSRASTSTSAPTTTGRPRGACSRSIRRPRGCRSRSSARIIDAHLDALLPLVEEYLPRDVARARGRAGARATRCAWCIARVDRRGDARARAARVRGAVLRPAAAASARRSSRARRAQGSRSRTSAISRRSSRRRCRSSSPARRRARCARSSRDMCSDRRMHRLLQGDVGSGKTIVALFAALLAIENGYQAAIMAPTELLAEQHARTFDALLAPLGIDAVLLTGSLPARERRAAIARAWRPASRCSSSARTRSCRSDTSSRSSASSAIDEQHRFGVEQRKALGAKGERPDVLLMTRDADPALARAHAVRRSRPQRARRASAGPAAGHDGAAPRVGARARAAVRRPRDRAGTAGVHRLSGDRGVGEDRPQGGDDDVRVARRRARSRTGASRCCTAAFRPTSGTRSCARFRDGEIDVLVATTVIEVGIDVANATVMLIEHPERFGLSQLHQLRGRVGRGAEESYCILLGDVSPEAARAAAALRRHRGRLRDRARGPAAARHGRPVRRAAERRADVPGRRSHSRRGAQRLRARRARRSCCAAIRSSRSASTRGCARCSASATRARSSSSGWARAAATAFRRLRQPLLDALQLRLRLRSASPSARLTVFGHLLLARRCLRRVVGHHGCTRGTLSHRARPAQSESITRVVRCERDAPRRVLARTGRRDSVECLDGRVRDCTPGSRDRA